jgi:phosphatidylinositol alpha-1,6-mannosyltransferase
MRVAFYTPFVPLSHPRISGDVVIARNLVEALRRQGHDVCVLPDLSTETALGSWRGALRIPGLLREIHRVASDFRPDVWLTCYCDSLAPDLPGMVLAHRLGARYIIYGAVQRGGSGRRRPRAWGSIINRLALGAADHVVVNKTRDLDGHARLRWLRGKLSLLRPAVPTAEFRRDPIKRERTRRGLGVAGGTVVLLAAARLTHRGGGRKVESLRFLIDSVAALERPAAEVLLLIAGEGKARLDLEEHAAALRDRVRFIGAIPHEEMSSLYDAADIFCYPGLREPIGMVYLEAQASGLPIVAFRNGGIPEVVRDGETGFLVPRLDGAAFTARLNELIADRGLRERMGDAGIAHVLANHDLDGWGSALTGLLEGGSAGAGVNLGRRR